MNIFRQLPTRWLVRLALLVVPALLFQCVARRPVPVSNFYLQVHLPAPLSPGEQLYVASPLGNWQPNAPAFRMARRSELLYTLQIDTLPPSLAYKYTKGSWDEVETFDSGEDRPNRQLNPVAGTAYADTVLAWKPVGIQQPSTAAENVKVWQEALAMEPMEGKTRRVWVYLPPDYHQTDRHYPVVYLQDGQNLFDRKTAFSGEWEVDETLNGLHAAYGRGVIVIGVEHGQSDRITEYAPFANNYGGADGALYARFLAETLKPLADRTFRTLPGPEHTVVGGSSMGGLIAFYTALTYPQVFGRAMVFSPSFGIAEQAVRAFTEQQNGKEKPVIFLLAGTDEGYEMPEKVQKAADLLLAGGAAPERLQVALEPGGRHEEALWRKWFPQALGWLLGW